MGKIIDTFRVAWRFFAGIAMIVGFLRRLTGRK